MKTNSPTPGFRRRSAFALRALPTCVFALGTVFALPLANQAPLSPPASEPARIYLANDDHTDFMWTADADTYHRVFGERPREV